MEPLLIILIAAIVVIAVFGFVMVRVLGGDRDSEIVRDSVQKPGSSTKAPAKGLRSRLGKTRQALASSLGGLLRRSEIDAEFWSDLEDTLVAADLGVATAEEVVAEVQAANPVDGEAARTILEDRLIGMLAGKDRSIAKGSEPAVLLVVGVNGTGKTTSIAKLAAQFAADGESVVLGAADTFRAAAGDQLKEWGSRIDVPVVGGQAGADPAAVAYDAYHTGKNDGVDRVIVDTAGRLHSKANLMDELSKVAKVLRREAGEIDETLLVLDGTTGQNAVEQARVFTDTVGVSGIVITKLDGTSRGGMAIAVERDLNIPVKYIGVGEGIDDLIPFDPDEFVDALLGA